MLYLVKQKATPIGPSGNAGRALQDFREVEPTVRGGNFLIIRPGPGWSSFIGRAALAHLHRHRCFTPWHDPADPTGVGDIRRLQGGPGIIRQLRRDGRQQAPAGLGIEDNFAVPDRVDLGRSPAGLG